MISYQEWENQYYEHIGVDLFKGLEEEMLLNQVRNEEERETKFFYQEDKEEKI